MNVLSLFDGISCGQIALGRAGIVVDNYFAYEIDKNAISITNHHYPKTIQMGNVVGADFSELPRIDLLIGGSPCQDLSRCNTKNEGLSGEKSKLFFEFIKAMQYTKPTYYLFENVGSMTKENKEIICSYFNAQPITINSNLLSAQSRDRIYWTNIKNIKQPKDANILVKDIISHDVGDKYFLKKDYIYVPKKSKHNSKRGLKYVCGIISKKKWIDNDRDTSRSFSQGNRVYSINGKSCTINANAGGLGGKSGLYYLEDGKDFNKNNIRRLTPTETERLQTIPDKYTSLIGETNRYKCIGNGWTVDVIAHILKNIVCI